jgi:glutaminase
MVDGADTGSFMETLQQVVDQVNAELSARLGEGKVADYIPELAKVPLTKFGIAVVTATGEMVTAGDAREEFSIQSVSKLFTLTLALGRMGDRLWQRVDREPSGNAFNSIVQLEHEHGRPRNPFVNAGAIAVTDAILSGHRPKEAIGEILRFMRFLANDDGIIIDARVARSEQATGDRNAALAHFMRSYGVIEQPPAEVLGVYFHQCAIAMNCVQLARAGLFLAARGCDPLTGMRVVSAARARRINSLMMMCGHYDGAGDFAFRVGLPGKSGVGGGIIAIVPGKASIAVWSPGLDGNGNSLVGTAALEQLTTRLGWSVFG